MMRHSLRRLLPWIMVGILTLLFTTFGSIVQVAMAASVVNTVPTAATGDWPTYLSDKGRSGFNAAETIINPGSVSNLKLHWTYQDPAQGLISVQPVEANGLIYWGSWNDGIEHATDKTGKQVWGTSVGTSPPANCGSHTLGVASTATVASEVIGGTNTSVLYVGGGDVNFYALNAKTGVQIWKTPLGTKPDYFIWSSPAVYKGSVYIGLSSRGDCPLVQGELIQLNAVTGNIVHTFKVVPNGCIGGSVWGSPTIDQSAGTVYFATGNGGTCSSSEKYAVAMVELRASDLSFVGAWQVPTNQEVSDGDFGSTPTLFSATIGGVVTKLVGVPNKNGIYYAFKRDAITSGPVWEATVAIGGDCPECGNGSISPSAWDGSNLYVAGGNTKINGVSCQGSLRALNPATGAFLWEKCLNDGAVLAAVSAVTGVAFVGEGSHLVAIATASGKKLFDFDTGSTIYEAASISHGIVYVGSINANLYAFGM